MKLEVLRKKIDRLDCTLMQILSKRFSLIKEINQCKKELRLSIKDKDRERQILENMLNKSKSLKLRRKFIRKIVTEILKESRELQRSRYL